MLRPQSDALGRTVSSEGSQNPPPWGQRPKLSVGGLPLCPTKRHLCSQPDTIPAFQFSAIFTLHSPGLFPGDNIQIRKRKF